jgi:hypothetical protein
VATSQLLLISAQLGKTLYHQGDLSYFEAVNKETLKNSFRRFEEEGIVQVVRSKDAKVPARLRIAPDWRSARDAKTGNLVLEGKLWDFTEKIASCRREGKNRRDGATVSTRVLRLTDTLGRKLLAEAQVSTKDYELSQEDKDTLERSGRKGRRRRTLQANL